MNPRLKAAQDRLQALIADGKALRAMDAHDDDQSKRYAALPDLIKQAQSVVEQEASAASVLDASEAFLNGRAALPSVASVPTAKETFNARKKAPVARGRSAFFSMISDYSGQEASAAAYGFGRWLLASQGHGPSKAYCAEHGIPVVLASGFFAAGQSDGDSEKGAALVPPQYEADLIILREKFGIFRQYSRITPMSSETLNRPRRKGGVTAYHVGGGASITESDAQWNLVQLVAKKIACLVRYESEISEDSILAMGDLLAGEIAYAFAKQEDQDGFIGDGTSTYGGIVGVGPKLQSVYGTGGGVGLVNATGDEWSEITLTDFQKVKAALPQYAETPNTAWFCHKAFFETVMAPLALAAGGVTAAEIIAGVRRQFLGYPVVISQIMSHTADVVSDVPILFGDLSLASMFGDRRATTIAMSDQFLFNTDQLMIRGTERVDINVHDVGDTTNHGPIVGLQTPSS